MNADKTKCVNIAKYRHKNMQPNTQNIHYKEYQKAAEFKCLGLPVTYGNDCGKDIHSRITAGNQSYQAPFKNIKSSSILKNLKIYAPLIKPILLCGYETWTLRE
jgi:hypothetical protein